jgi:uncharacterized protein (TIGR03435 family)
VDRKESPVYFLTVDQSGHKLTPSKTEGPRRAQADATGLAFQQATMTDLQNYLSSQPFFARRPVVNRTSLAGRFDFKLAILSGADTDEARKAALASASFIVFADALKEVGLRLDPGNIPIDLITIEKAEKPSEN